MWGPDLTEEDLKGLVRGGDRNNVLPHTGYDESLDERSIGFPSPPVNIARFTAAGDPPFFQLSPDIMEVPDLEPHEFPAFTFMVPEDNPLQFDQGPGASPGAGASPNTNKKKAAANQFSPALFPPPPKNYVKLPDPIMYTNPSSAIHGMYVIFFRLSFMYCCVGAGLVPSQEAIDLTGDSDVRVPL